MNISDIKITISRIWSKGSRIKSIQVSYPIKKYNRTFYLDAASSSIDTSLNKFIQLDSPPSPLLLSQLSKLKVELESLRSTKNLNLQSLKSQLDILEQKTLALKAKLEK